MASQEGSRTPFELLFTRFKVGKTHTAKLLASFVRPTEFLQAAALIDLTDTMSRLFCCAAPTMVVYDNACNLQRYALKRAPHFFRHAAFRIDRLHIFAHRG